jgi:hypothetical protein
MAMNMQNAGAEPALARGDAAAAKGDFAGAVAAYREALKHDGRSVDACRKLLGLFRDSRHAAPGLEVAQRLLALEPRSVYARAAVADMLEMGGRLDEAYAMAAPPVNAGQRDPYLVTVFGRICGRMEPPRDEGIAPLGQVVAHASVQPRARVKALWALVHSLDALGRYDEAFARAQELKAFEKSSGLARPPANWSGIDASIACRAPRTARRCRSSSSACCARAPRSPSRSSPRTRTCTARASWPTSRASRCARSRQDSPTPPASTRSTRRRSTRSPKSTSRGCARRRRRRSAWSTRCRPTSSTSA